MVMPWPRISTTLRAPRLCASAAPSARERIKRSVPSPAASRISNTGAGPPMKPHMWKIGRSVAPGTTPNGLTEGEWLWITAITSGRAR